MNTCANMAGGIAPIVTARIATHFGWSQALDFAAIVSLMAGVIWLFVNADSSLETAISANGADAGMLAGVSGRN
jgi:sugar phosphate permease